MKKIFFIVCLFLLTGLASAQVNRYMASGICADTLKSTQKIVNVLTDYPYNANFTIAIKTVSGIDTVYISTISRDSVYNTSKVCIDLSTGSPVTSLIATTTAKEYMIYDPQVYRVTLTTTNGLVTTLFTVSRK